MTLQQDSCLSGCQAVRCTQQMEYNYLQIAKMIDHSLLNPILTDQEMEDGCRLALAYDVASVCIKPYYLKKCAELLAGSTVAPSTVIGFPHGGNTTKIKSAETEQALADGGTELDMVVNIGKVLSEDWDYVREDIRAVTDLTHQGGAIVKVIFENCYLLDQHKIRLCEICAEVGADFVKTSDRIRDRRSDHGGPQTHAETFSAARARQSGGRNSHSRRVARSSGDRRIAVGRYSHEGDARRVQTTFGRYGASNRI